MAILSIVEMMNVVKSVLSSFFVMADIVILLQR